MTYTFDELVRDIAFLLIVVVSLLGSLRDTIHDAEIKTLQQTVAKLEERTKPKSKVCCEGLPKHTYEMTAAEKKQYKVEDK
jgi:hypothetical protein